MTFSKGTLEVRNESLQIVKMRERRRIYNLLIGLIHHVTKDDLSYKFHVASFKEPKNLYAVSFQELKNLYTVSFPKPSNSQTTAFLNLVTTIKFHSKICLYPKKKKSFIL